MASPLHFVLCDFKSGPAWVERDPKDMDRATTVKDIADGQLENVLQVLEVEFGATAILAQDVTRDVAFAVSALLDDKGDRLTNGQYAFIEQHCGTAAARCFARA